MCHLDGHWEMRWAEGFTDGVILSLYKAWIAFKAGDMELFDLPIVTLKYSFWKLREKV